MEPMRGSLEVVAAETVTEIDYRPHLLLGVDVRGGNFPQRAEEPFVRVVARDGDVVQSWFARISGDGTRLRGYFPVDAPRPVRVEYGYGDDVYGAVDTEDLDDKIVQLDQQRLGQEGELVVVDTALLRERRGET